MAIHLVIKTLTAEFLSDFHGGTSARITVFVFDLPTELSVKCPGCMVRYGHIRLSSRLKLCIIAWKLALGRNTQTNKIFLRLVPSTRVSHQKVDKMMFIFWILWILTLRAKKTVTKRLTWTSNLNKKKSLLRSVFWCFLSTLTSYIKLHTWRSKKG